MEGHNVHLNLRPIYPINGWGNGELRPRAWYLGWAIATVAVLACFIFQHEWRYVVGCLVGVIVVGGSATSEPQGVFSANGTLLKAEWRSDWSAVTLQTFLGCMATFACCSASIYIVTLLSPPNGADSMPMRAVATNLGGAAAGLFVASVLDHGSVFRGLARHLIFAEEVTPTWEIHAPAAAVTEEAPKTPESEILR